MRSKLSFCCAVALALLCLGMSQLSARGADMKLEVQLLWGTDDAKSPNPKHKPISPELQKKLAPLPLKWKNYFEENRKSLDLPAGASRKAALSDSCELEVKNVDGSQVEVTHYGKGKKVATRTQVLPKGEILALGGNAPNATAWLIVVKRLE
jgi:hypothetical protein